MNKLTDNPIQPRILFLLLVLSSLVALPHAMHMPLPVSLFFLLLILWRFGLFHYPRFSPHRLLLMLLTLCGLALVYTQHHTLIGRGAGVSLLTLMLALKMMEVRRQRDIYVVVFISFFVVVTQFLFNQSLLLAVYLIVLVLLLLALMLEINQARPSHNILDPLKRTLVITLQGLPLALILFILFPRISHPLWQLGGAGTSAISGLSERISPGSISQLIQSREVAFRVRFKTPPPAAEDRYWRGLVMWDTDGFEWYNRRHSATKESLRLFQARGQPVDYEISLEPHYQNWLFALDLPATEPKGTSMTGEYLLRTEHAVKRLFSYSLISFSKYRINNIGADDVQRALTLPDNVTHRTRELVQRWKSASTSAREIVEQALIHFNQEQFIYTLKPPLYTDNPVDQFLFEGRAGFCEHYASSFILLMRLAGIPARMVVGYQGGEFNPVGDYFILRQSDAHAWAEVWLEEQGWTRVDPTAAVAPDRIRHAILSEFDAVGSPVVFRIEDQGILGNTLRHLRLALDAVNIGWRRWILDYNRDSQFRLLQNIGLNLSRMQEWFGLMFTLIAVTLLGIGLRIGLQGRKRQDPVLALYKKFCARLAAAGIPRDLSEGPLDYSRRIMSLLPGREVEIREIFRCYIALRYGRAADSRIEAEFKERVRRFRP